MLLSIIIITHNQREQFRRCIESVLAQKIPFEYEVLISDDASSDGSFELAKEYAYKYPFVYAYYCDTNTKDASISPTRASYNRCNALQHAKGKYIYHVDGDDFFIEDSCILQKQVELLETHNNCSACMANCYTIKNGESIEKRVVMYPDMFRTGDVLKREDYIRYHFRVSHCFVYRSHTVNNPIDYFRGYYDDNGITAYYVQYGDIVCLQDAGHVYVQYARSLWHDMSKTNDVVVLCPALYNAQLYPMWKSVYWQSIKGLNQIIKVVNAAREELPVTDIVVRWMDGFDYYIYHAFNRPLSIWDKLHLFTLWLLLKMMIRTKRRHPRLPLPWRLLDKLL